MPSSICAVGENIILISVSVQRREENIKENRMKRKMKRGVVLKLDLNWVNVGAFVYLGNH